MRQIVSIPVIANRNELANLKNRTELGAGVNIVYVYFLSGKLLPYPKGESNILYVGEAMRDSEATGVRFRQHITPSAKVGADMGNNFTLSQYFHAGWDIGLSIFETDGDRLKHERDLIYAHIDCYGSPPIAQGKIPHNGQGKNRTTHIAVYIDDNVSAIMQARSVLTKIVAKHGPTISASGTPSAPSKLQR